MVGVKPTSQEAAKQLSRHGASTQYWLHLEPHGSHVTSNGSGHDPLYQPAILLDFGSAAPHSNNHDADVSSDKADADGVPQPPPAAGPGSIAPGVLMRVSGWPSSPSGPGCPTCQQRRALLQGAPDPLATFSDTILHVRHMQVMRAAADVAAADGDDDESREVPRPRLGYVGSVVTPPVISRQGRPTRDISVSEVRTHVPDGTRASRSTLATDVAQADPKQVWEMLRTARRSPGRGRSVQELQAMMGALSVAGPRTMLVVGYTWCGSAAPTQKVGGLCQGLVHI